MLKRKKQIRVRGLQTGSMGALCCTVGDYLCAVLQTEALQAAVQVRLLRGVADLRYHKRQM